MWPFNPPSLSAGLFVVAKKALFISNAVSDLFRKNLSPRLPLGGMEVQSFFRGHRENSGTKGALLQKPAMPIAQMTGYQ
jgi:hypothetical protein